VTDYEVPRDHPNVLLLLDADIYAGGSIDFTRLAGYFQSPGAGCPVSSNSHDYWIVHPWPASDGGVHTGGGPSRGMVRLGTEWNGAAAGATPALTVDSATSYYWEWLQEVAHAWLVPYDMTFDGETVGQERAFVQAFFDGAAIPRNCLIGRGNGMGHWSSFVSAGVSPMDGVDWNEEATLPVEGTGIFKRFSVGTIPGTNVNVAGLAPVPAPVYSDLDKRIMGVLSETESYPARADHSFDDLAPQWMAPLEFQAGLAVAFAPDDMIYFGFTSDFRTIGIARTGQQLAPTFDISSFYEPWVLDRRMYLRVVKQGDTYSFQARPEWGSIGCLGEILRRLHLYTAPPPITPFSETTPVRAPEASPSDWSRWNTLTTLTESSAPRGVGYIVKTWGGTPPMVDVNFDGLQIRDNEGDRTVTSVSDPVNAATYLDSLRSDTLTFHKPAEGPIHRPGRGAGNLVVATTVPDAELGTRDVGSLDHWTGVDGAPKLISAISGANEFVAAGSVRIDRAIMAPHAAGAVTGRELWGWVRPTSVSSTGLSQGSLSAQSYDDNHPYRMAFIIVAAQRSDIADGVIDSIDRLRQGAENYFPRATSNRRHVDTRLTRPLGHASGRR
jgi:hypothetical protein